MWQIRLARCPSLLSNPLQRVNNKNYRNTILHKTLFTVAKMNYFSIYHHKIKMTNKTSNRYVFKLVILSSKYFLVHINYRVVHPRKKWSSRPQTKWRKSQNYAFVYMRCFAKQTKYFRNSETYQTQTIVASTELKICSNGVKQLRNQMWRNITYLFREFMNELSV